MGCHDPIPIPITSIFYYFLVKVRVIVSAVSSTTLAPTRQPASHDNYDHRLPSSTVKVSTGMPKRRRQDGGHAHRIYCIREGPQ